jgi:hypothetical protein
MALEMPFRHTIAAPYKQLLDRSRAGEKSVGEGRMMIRHAFAPLLALSLSACAASTNPPASRNAASGRDVLTAAEIVSSRVTDAYQAVTQLRPHFLRRRTARPTAFNTSLAVVVYLDDLPYGGVESLQQIPLDRVRVIRYLSSVSANLRFGGSHPSGAILVTTLPDRKR